VHDVEKNGRKRVDACRDEGREAMAVRLRSDTEESNMVLVVLVEGWREEAPTQRVKSQHTILLSPESYVEI
jgi:hypothetical protein